MFQADDVTNEYQSDGSDVSPMPPNNERGTTVSPVSPRPVTLGGQDPARLPSFRHASLEDAGTQMRLLKYVPGAADESLEVTLSVWAMTETPEYAAISYTWGSEYPKKRITIDGRPFGVNENCWNALHRVRVKNSDMAVWIDAVCIDQAHTAEKSLQVRSMSQIYAQASIVWAVMGAGLNLFAEASMFEALQQLRSYYPECKGQRTALLDLWRQKDRLERLSYFAAYRWCLNSHLCGIMRNFGSSCYWTRIWIVPEVVSANHVTILYDGYEVEDFLVYGLYKELQDLYSGNGFILDAVPMIRTMASSAPQS
ncbi:hypothetical protein LTR36_000538 [Oleoguttula mirabilis]|uniref:Heterokaryon incompatibility domain-containing protein n=1 Tax=Oleoguttula mirabilis TaxID=1507867 RepID=A0AAV9JQ76_9PEZI|nr:hypothetical protein LTR36_000538 [Oleoguttula mirabilis]